MKKVDIYIWNYINGTLGKLRQIFNCVLLVKIIQMPKKMQLLGSHSRLVAWIDRCYHVTNM